jgi:hypothetical protein
MLGLLTFTGMAESAGIVTCSIGLILTAIATAIVLARKAHPNAVERPNLTCRLPGEPHHDCRPSRNHRPRCRGLFPRQPVSERIDGQP